MLKVLITGGAGFIGSNLAKKLQHNYRVYIVDNLSMGKKENISHLSNITFYEEDILNEEFMRNLLLRENFDYIFHLAAIASVADSIERPLETNRVNFLSTLNLLNILKSMENSSLKRFVFASSAAVYGNSINLPKKEQSDVNPSTPYAIDKYASEKYVLAYNSLYNLPTSCVRFFNVYGPNQNPSSPYSGVISILIDTFMKRMKNEDYEFNLYGDGEQSRDFVYIEDVVSALEIVLNSTDSLGQVYNVGTNKETTLNELIKWISEILNTNIKIQKLDERKGDIKRSYCSIQKLNKLGFYPKYSVKDGLRKYIEFLELKNKE